MSPLRAFTREPTPSIADCELTHLERDPIDLERAREEHGRYHAYLRELGCELEELPALPEHPDAVFVEDTAIVLDELAVLCRPGAASRRGEVESVARALAPWRELARVEAPATLDGGDVIRLGRRLFVGLSTRSDAAGVEALRRIVEPRGYSVEGVPVTDCLHLKSAACALGPEAVLVQESWVDPRAFGEVEVVLSDPEEPGAANVLCLGGDALYPLVFPRTAERLAAFGLRLHLLDTSELAKAEGAVTCCSLIVETPSS